MPDRIYYRSEEEFKAALDKAVESIDSTRRFGRIDAVIWFGLLGILAVLYLTRWTLGWQLHAAIPGIDLRRTAWLCLGVYVAFYHLRARHRHSFILRGRLCLACGTRLLRVPVDELGDGRCPTCGREFNVGQYRRPSEARGTAFRGYLDAKHFDKAMQEAGERILVRRGSQFECDLMGAAWVGLGVAIVCSVFFDVSVVAALPGASIWYLVWFGAVSIWSADYTRRIKRIVPSIVADRRCLECGYRLQATATDERGLGRCPECASTFHVDEYVRPETVSEPAST